MSTDVFEDELRTLLHDATDAQSSTFADVDAGAVLAGGRRLVRRRRVTMVGGTLAAALVVAVGTWAAVGDTADRAVTRPAGTETRSASTARTTVLDRFGDLTGPDGRPLRIPGPRRVAVTIDPDATPDLVYSSVAADGGLTPMGGASLEGIGPLAATWGTAGRGAHVLVGVLPAQARAVQLVTPLTDEGGHPSTTVRGEFPSTGRQAFAVRFAESSDAEAVRHLVWWGTDGVVHDEDGNVVPSASLGDDAGTTVFLATSLDRMGTFSEDGGASMTALDGSRNSSGRPVLASAQGDSGGMTGLFVAVVPAGSTPGVFTPAPGTTVTHPLTRVPLDGSDRVLLWAGYTTAARASGSAWTSVTWTEPGNGVVTERG